MPVLRRRRGLLVIGLSIALSVQLAVTAALGALQGPAVVTPTDSRPNIVIVLVDDMGWSDIGPYGGEIPTPNLDALARGGVRFTQFYATPRCSPSRASLLTGLYPHQAGMGHLDSVIRAGSAGTTGRLNERSVTIAEVLRDAGYFTAMAGKWHLGQQNGSPPWERGFDRVLNLRAGGMFFPEVLNNPAMPTAPQLTGRRYFRFRVTLRNNNLTNGRQCYNSFIMAVTF